MKVIDKKIPYNFTPVDNNLIDHEMRYMTGGEFKHYIYTARKTIGTKVGSRTSSVCMDEFMEYTGMSNQGTINAIKGLERAGFVAVERGKKGSKKINKVTILMLDKEKYIREKLKNMEDVEIVSSEIISLDKSNNLTCEPSDKSNNLTPLTDVTDIKTAEHQKNMQLAVENAQFVAEEITAQVEKVYSDIGVRYNPKSNDKDFNPIYDMFRVNGYTFEDVFATVEFAFSDSFWKTVIVSTSNFKKNYAKLRKAMSSYKQKPVGIVGLA